MKVSQKVKVKNPLGLHARPATIIARLLQQRKASVLFTYGEATINARSIMSILTLAAPQNSQILITADGDDAEETVTALVQAFEKEFGEMT